MMTSSLTTTTYEVPTVVAVKIEKRGRKRKNLEETVIPLQQQQQQQQQQTLVCPPAALTANPPKKRGRKPKFFAATTAEDGGDQQQHQQQPLHSLPFSPPSVPPATVIALAPVILHLKCTMAEYKDFLLKMQPDTNTMLPSSSAVATTAAAAAAATTSTSHMTPYQHSPHDMMEHLFNQHVLTKLRALQVQLQQSPSSLTFPEKRSACFWCTCDFFTPPCYLFTHENSHGMLFNYGCFCQPECAVAYLMQEKQIDDSTRFDRLDLLHRVYNPIFYNQDGEGEGEGEEGEGCGQRAFKSITPAPDPRSTLDKYLGTLTIEEYRWLSRKHPILLTIDKPMTRFLPEVHDSLHENHNEYRVRRQSEIDQLQYLQQQQQQQHQQHQQHPLAKKQSHIFNHFGMMTMM